MLDTSKMTSEEKKLFDFEIACGMRDRATGELFPQFVINSSKDEPKVEDKPVEAENEPVEETPKKRGRRQNK